MAATSAAGPDSLPVATAVLLPKLLGAGASAVSLEHLDRSDLQLLLSARGQPTEGSRDCLLSRLQVVLLAFYSISCLDPCRRVSSLSGIGTDGPPHHFAQQWHHALDPEPEANNRSQI